MPGCHGSPGLNLAHGDPWQLAQKRCLVNTEHLGLASRPWRDAEAIPLGGPKWYESWGGWPKGGLAKEAGRLLQRPCERSGAA